MPSRPTKTTKRTATTGEILVHLHDDGSWRIWIPVEPVPASRPRFSRWGGIYYGKKYTQFRKQVAELLENSGVSGLPLEQTIHIDVVFHVQRPKKTTRRTPRGDVDNYFKTLDVLNGVIWKDDDQIESALMTKTYADDQPGIELTVYEQLSETRALPEMP